MKTIVNKITFFAATLGFFIVGCSDKDLSVQPRQSISSETALTSVNSVDAAVIGVYATLKSRVLYGRDFMLYGDVMADNAVATNKSGRLVGEGRNNNGAHFVNWGTAYSAINDCNLVLNAIPKISAASQTLRDRWEGEMRFIRALLYHDLMRVYAYSPTYIVTASDRGGVVLRSTAVDNKDTAANFKPARASIAECYNFIINDLTISSAKLATTARAGAPHFATRAAAQALLARVQLYNGNWAAASTAATNALTGGVGTLTTAANHVAGWRATTHPESIFEVRFAIAAESLGVNEALQTSCTSMGAIGSPFTNGGWGDCAPNLLTLNALGISGVPSSLSISNAIALPTLTRSTDVRNLLYEWGGQPTNPRFIECTKYFQKSGFLNTDNVPVIRHAEVLLIRAEANLRLNNEAEALNDINTLRVNRGLTPVTLTGNSILEEILNQRLVELNMEGHRFHDLKRLGRDIVKDPSVGFVFAITDFRVLAQIPNGELIGNPNMQQNVGY
ncbi:MAG: RagB/SusD family nutrient uptake outer membrane protein [Sediminibacterium sp.]